MRISLPRLVHFFDLVLPQLMPVQVAWTGEEKTRGAVIISGISTNWRTYKNSYFFTSHDHIHHVRIQWESHPSPLL